jgi:hypothetical protein
VGELTRNARSWNNASTFKRKNVSEPIKALLNDQFGFGDRSNGNDFVAFEPYIQLRKVGKCRSRKVFYKDIPRKSSDDIEKIAATPNLEPGCE